MNRTLTDADRTRATEQIRAFAAEFNAGANGVVAELTDDSYPELRIIKTVQNRPLTPSEVIASGAVLGAVEKDYSVFCTGLFIGCNFLSEAMERARELSS